MDLPTWELSISHSDENYSFTLNNPNAGGLSFRDTLRVPAAVRDDIVDRSGGSRQPAHDAAFDKRLTEAGALIFRRMLPKSIQDVLVKLDRGCLAIATDEPAILWESAFFNNSFLGLRVAVARRMIARTLPDPKPRPERPALEMLVIADTRGDLRQASAEADAIEELFANESLVHVRVLRRAEATTGNVLDQVNGNAYDIVHYAGHVDAHQPGEATLKLADGDITASYLAGQFSSSDLPQIVFINGCSSGTSADAVSEQPGFGGDVIASMAGTFLTTGVGSYVGTLWDVTDVAASRIAGSFYKALLEGLAVGDALLSARQAAADVGAAGWAAYLLYGRPNQMIAGVQPVIERRRNLASLRRLITSEREVERRQAAIRLGKLGMNEATKELAAACHDPSQAVRWRAVEGLAKIGTPAAIAALAEYLLEADRDSILQALVVARSKFSVEQWEAVAGLADAPHDRAVRANALAALSWIPHDSLRSRLAGYLDDDDPLIQWTALNGLARLGSLAAPVLQTYQPDDLILESRRQQIVGAGRPAPAPAASRPGIPVILDCDAGLDDGVAMALAALHPDCALQAVTIVGGGNALVADGMETASAILQLCGRDDVPVLGGLGRGGAKNTERSKVFEQLADIILEHEGRCVFVATGPLTNVAVLLRAFPQLVTAIKEIVFLGGAFWTIGNVGPIQEANVCADPEAADAVFRSGARIRIVPLDVSQRLTVDAADGERLGSPEAPLLQQQLAVMLAPLLAYYRIVFGRDSCPIHDPLAVAMALRPELFRLRRLAVTVEVTGDLTRGVTVRDERPEADGENVASPIEVADEVDLAGVRALLAGVLPAPSARV